MVEFAFGLAPGDPHFNPLSCSINRPSFVLATLNAADDTSLSGVRVVVELNSSRSAREPDNSLEVGLQS
jgi:hypothetical protein